MEIGEHFGVRTRGMAFSEVDKFFQKTKNACFCREKVDINMGRGGVGIGVKVRVSVLRVVFWGIF